MNERSLSVSKLCVARAGKRVLHDVDLRIERGQITALLGANGAGKSTLVLAMSGVLRPESGDVLLGETSLLKRRPEDVRRAGVVAVPEGHHVLSSLSVRDNLEAAGSMLGRREMRAGVERVLETFPELRPKLNDPAGNLSGGQQQIVALAQAMVAPPTFLLADELSFGLAPIVVARLIPVLVELANAGVGILLIEQFTTIALRIATNAYVLERGRIAYAGSSDELRRNPDILHMAYL
jgi:branched-chain amino acid transport system ATP-binding protein